MDKLKSAIALIREEFSDVTMAEMKELTGEDRQQLASAIARNRGISPEECNFEHVEY